MFIECRESNVGSRGAGCQPAWADKTSKLCLQTSIEHGVCKHQDDNCDGVDCQRQQEHDCSAQEESRRPSNRPRHLPQAAPPTLKIGRPHATQA